MVDLSKFSADVRGRIEKIMATKTEDGGGKDAKSIDSQKEYKELGKLLSGDGKVTGKQREFVEGMLADYEDTFMVRDEVKQRVADFVKNGNAKTADDNAEIQNLKAYKKTKGLSKEEKAFIQRVIDGKEINQSVAQPKEAPSNSADVPKTNSTRPAQEDTPASVQQEPKAKAAPRTAPRRQTKAAPQQPPKAQPETPAEGNTKADKVLERNPESTVSAKEKPKVSNTPSNNKPTVKELNGLTKTIHNAVDGLGTDEAALFNALGKVNENNIIELLEHYNSMHEDMFGSVLDDLSGEDYARAVRIFTHALAKRGNNSKKMMYHKGAIKNELDQKIRSDKQILAHLHGMVLDIRAGR